jgi:hypothetical protein
MVKLIRANQKKFLAGLTILSMITFLVNRGTGGDRSANDRVYGTANGKPIYTSEVAEARAELSALKSYLDFSSVPTDEQGHLQNPQAELMHELILAMSSRADWYLLLRHEADTDGMQVSNDDIETVLTNYTKDLQPDSDPYLATRAGVEHLLKIIDRYQQIASMAKISRPLAEHEMVAQNENIQLDVIQQQAADFAAKVPPPTPQQLQDQFKQFAGIEPHHPTPTTNPFGFGYQLPQRAKVQSIRLSTDAVTAAVVATKSAYDWEVQARKYYLAHLDEFPTTAPSTSPVANAPPIPPLPYKAVADRVLTEIRQPLVTNLTDQAQRQIVSALTNDWSAYSQFLASGKTGEAPLSSLGVAYTAPDYLLKLAASVQAKFKVAVAVAETPTALSQEQIGQLPDIGTTALAEAAMTQASDYLKAVADKDPAAPAKLTQPSPVETGSDGTSVVIFRLSQALAEEPAPSLDTVLPQVTADVRDAAAYKLAEAAARDIVTNIKDRPLFIAATTKNPVVKIDHLSIGSYDVPQVKPPLGDSAQAFTIQAFKLLESYNPATNRNPAQVITLPQQGRAFAAQLSFVDANWNADNYFLQSLRVRYQALQGEQAMVRNAWFDYDAVQKRTDFKSAAKNTAG